MATVCWMPGASASVPATSQLQAAAASTAVSSPAQTSRRWRCSRTCVSVGLRRASTGGITVTRASADPNTENSPATDRPRAKASGSPPSTANDGSIAAGLR